MKPFGPVGRCRVRSSGRRFAAAQSVSRAAHDSRQAEGIGRACILPSQLKSPIVPECRVSDFLLVHCACQPGRPFVTAGRVEGRRSFPDPRRLRPTGSSSTLAHSALLQQLAFATSLRFPAAPFFAGSTAARFGCVGGPDRSFHSSRYRQAWLAAAHCEPWHTPPAILKNNGVEKRKEKKETRY